MNRYFCIGRWSKEIELKFTQAGKAVATSTVAINEKYGGNESTTFLPVVIWGKTAETVAEHSKKGRLVALEGRIQVRSWDSDNGKRYVTEIVADAVQFLDSGKQEQKDPFQGEGRPIDIDDPF